MAEAGKEQAGLALPGGGAAQWPLQRYGRFMPSGTGEPPGPGQDAGAASSPTWKVRPEGRKGREALNPEGGWWEGPRLAGTRPGPPNATQAGGGDAAALAGLASRQLTGNIYIYNLIIGPSTFSK